jgi:HAD superfamily hydrolase (TIGR01450 family)
MPDTREQQQAIVAFIGLGAMGGRMARRLLDAGYRLTVWNRSEAKTRDLAEMGAKVAPTPASAAAEADVVISMVTDAEALHAVMEGEHGVLAGIQGGTTLVDMSTVGPGAVGRLASQLPATSGIVDAPVLGSVAEAESGSLTIFAGGGVELVERVSPVLSHLGRVVHVGPPGRGAAAKLVANASLFNTLGALGEALALGDALGLSRDATYQVLESTPLAAQAARRRPAIEANEFPARFRLALARKDAELIEEAARAEGVDIRVTRAAGSWVADADGRGWGDRDYSSVLAHITGERGPSISESGFPAVGQGAAPLDFDGFIVDLDGVIWRGGTPIPGAAEAVSALRASGRRVVFLTNEPSRSPAEFAARLAGMGIPATETDVMTSAVATARAGADWAEQARGKRAFVIGPTALHDEVRATGLNVLEVREAAAADVVIVGGHDGFSYAELRAATLAVRGGAKLFATGRDAVFPTADGLAPGTGAVLAAVETAGGATATVVGKPEPSILAMAREVLSDCARVAVVGDHLIADIAGARRAGLATILVLSGVTSRSDLDGMSIAPDVILESVADLPDMLVLAREPRT